MLISWAVNAPSSVIWHNIDLLKLTHTLQRSSNLTIEPTYTFYFLPKQRTS